MIERYVLIDCLEQRTLYLETSPWFKSPTVTLQRAYRGSWVPSPCLNQSSNMDVNEQTWVVFMGNCFIIALLVIDARTSVAVEFLIQNLVKELAYNEPGLMCSKQKKTVGAIAYNKVTCGQYMTTTSFFSACSYVGKNHSSTISKWRRSKMLDETNREAPQITTLLAWDNR